MEVELLIMEKEMFHYDQYGTRHPDISGVVFANDDPFPFELHASQSVSEPFEID